MMWAVIISTLLLFGFGGVALGATLMAAGLTLFGLFVGGGGNLAIAFEGVWATLNNFAFSAILLFVLIGELFFASGLSTRSYGAVAPLFQRIPGRLLHTNVVVCMMFGAVSGTSSATAAAVGAAAYPELSRRKYHKGTIVGSLAAAGTLGLLIPPSLTLILFGAMTDTSIGKLFLAGIVPALGFGLAFMIFIAARTQINPSLLPKEYERLGLVHCLTALVQVWPLIFLMFSVLGPLYSGMATPTESAAFGFFMVLLLGLTIGDLTPTSLVPVLMSAMAKYGAIVFVIVGAVVLKTAVAMLGLPRELIAFISESGLGPYTVFFGIVVIYIALGCLFDGISMLLLTVPFIAPLLFGLGFDPVWLGVIITILIEIGMVTPPVGPNLFILSSIANNEVSVGEAARETLPYWLILLSGIAILTIVPEVVTWLPDKLLGSVAD
ncbi:TRAP transporter large permease [Ruegeria atlantica]|uniref:TRAP transporter large permease n=1 Tax=Ruegeria atlantica TaxID=81569 RepID=UPI001480E476|nr:TRAP transporter large permease [Ruegeria atlantica]